MRLVRLAALFGSLVLLAATTVSLVNRRAENRTEQLTRVETAADIVSVDISSNIESARVAVELAGLGAVVDGADRAGLARDVARLFDGADACVGASSTDCSGTDLFPLDLTGELSSESGASDGAVVAVDAASGAVLFVYRPAVSGAAVTSVLRVPVAALARASTTELATSQGAAVVIDVASRDTGDSRNDPTVIDGERVVLVTIGDPFVDGSVTIRTSIDAEVGLAAGSPGRYGTLLALGTVLLALAGWTFLAERKSLEKRATTDELTGLVNRREFERVASEGLDMADRFGTGLCVMVIDLNGFKQINDTLGHQFGDLVLKASSERLVAAVRDTDVVGRWGGDEFVIMLPGLEDRTAVRNSAERISRTLSESPVVGDTMMTASIGAAIFPRHGTTLDALMRAADVAMYGAKTTGVGHRIADTIAAQDDLFGDDMSTAAAPDDAVPIVDTADYAGPDRRRSPVPPPPPPLPPVVVRPSSLSTEQRAGSESALRHGIGTGSDSAAGPPADRSAHRDDVDKSA
ncbi:MAG: diguanylate cyclase [Ilumatobacter sp.]|uniref:diguanylate cyclase n=1 Tax=Ilumatobacter sp. TaxID=1967498 RepID=UPI00391C0232